MKNQGRILRYFVALVMASILFSGGESVIAQPNEEKLSADSMRQDGVPQGEIIGPIVLNSKVFPGTVRNYWVYVPAQYDSGKAACLCVVQDGLGRANGFKLPIVMDNLIHKKEIPVMLGVFVTPGVVPPVRPDAQPRFNRSFEYDGMGDRYASMLIDELIPEVEKLYNISDDPNDRMITGASSGAIAAFTAAWERPDAFRRVFTAIGTFVSLRGGNEYPILIRKFEPKPIRVFLQDGKNDNNLYGGSWWVANQDVLAALQFSGYDVDYRWGEGGHNGRHSAAIMPDVMRWLWRDYPNPITPGQAPERRTDLVIPGENWELITNGHQYCEGPAIAPNGELYFSDVPSSKIHRVSKDGSVSVFDAKSKRANGLMFGPDGLLYACQMESRSIVRYSKDGKPKVVVAGVDSNDICLLPHGGYFTDPKNNKVWHFTYDGKKEVVDEGIEFPNGLIATPDHAFLVVADKWGRFTYSFKIEEDGSLTNKQRLGHVHLLDDDRRSGSDGMTIDKEGRVYVATQLGVQIFDQLGRCHLILTKPGSGSLTNLTFGGEKGDVLFVTCGGAVYKRKLKTSGGLSVSEARKVPRPNL